MARDLAVGLTPWSISAFCRSAMTPGAQAQGPMADGPPAKSTKQAAGFALAECGVGVLFGSLFCPRRFARNEAKWLLASGFWLRSSSWIAQVLR
jgi:hypothetical protein